MFVSQSHEKEFLESYFAFANIPTSRQTIIQKAQPKPKLAKTKNQKTSDGKTTTAKVVVAKKTAANTIAAKTSTKGKTTKKLLKKEISKNKSYTEEPISRETLNIYSGNPGHYVDAGDVLNFGTVMPLSDADFLNLQRTIVPQTEKPYGIVGKELIIPKQDWVLGIILIFWMIFASVRVGFLKYLGQLFVSLVNLNASARLYQQRGYKTMYGAVRLDVIFHLILPLSVYQIASFYKIDIPGYPSILFFFALFIVINGYLFTKIFLFKLAGSVIMMKEQTDESIFNIKLFYKALGLLLLPVVTIHAIIASTNFVTLWIMVFLIAMMYVATIVRTIYIGNRKGISFFYLILYLCTLEILPLLFVFKLAGTN